MGVTIHFEGKLKSADALMQVVAIAEHLATEENWPTARFKEVNKILERIAGEKEWNYQGPTQGIVIEPENTEPFILEFDDNFYIQEYCKTQFAPIETHIRLIEILRAIGPYFVNLEVVDEGEYWDANDTELLQKNVNECFNAIAEAKAHDSDLDGPFVLESGRIIDLMQVQCIRFTMAKQAITTRMAEVINQLPDAQAAEISDFAEVILKRYEKHKLTQGLQQLAAEGQEFAFLNDEEELYTEADLKEAYAG